MKEEIWMKRMKIPMDRIKQMKKSKQYECRCYYAVGVFIDIDTAPTASNEHNGFKYITADDGEVIKFNTSQEAEEYLDIQGFTKYAKLNDKLKVMRCIICPGCGKPYFFTNNKTSAEHETAYVTEMNGEHYLTFERII